MNSDTISAAMSIVLTNFSVYAPILKTTGEHNVTMALSPKYNHQKLCSHREVFGTIQSQYGSQPFSLVCASFPETDSKAKETPEEKSHTVKRANNAVRRQAEPCKNSLFAF